jgi:NAD(P)-dependent dehydrogenase (short-subunit alcohol dehydrogenase family)
VSAKKLAIVTGGTSGIGAAVAEKLAADYELALVYRSDHGKAERFVKKLRNARAYAIELEGHAGCEDVVARVRRDFLLAPSVLVVAHGRALDSLFLQSDSAEGERLLGELLLAPMALARAVLPDMAKAKAGRVVFVTSIAARRHLPGRSVYATAKAGLEAFTQALAIETGRYGVTVNAVAPGGIDTPLLRDYVESEAYVAGLPVPRLGRPEEVASVVHFLCSAEASYVNGAIVPVDGGASAAAVPRVSRESSSR